MKSNPSQPSTNRSVSPPKESPSGISAASFYGPPSQTPPALPARPRPGSSLTKTTFIPDTEASTPPPPTYGNTAGTVPIASAADIPDDMPGLIPDDNSWQVTTASEWDAATTNQWDTTTTNEWSNWYSSSHKVLISHRNQEEETTWWDRDVHAKAVRPGTGASPAVVVNGLHDADHTLFSVTATQPQVSLEPAPVSLTASPASTPNEAPSLPPGLTQLPPTDDEVRQSVPHPNAYYCKAEHGWVLLSWQSSSIPPPFTNEFLASKDARLPDAGIRNLRRSCIDTDDRKNFTHHLHRYEQAVDSTRLAVPFYSDEWQLLSKPNNSDGTGKQGELLDAYICCQCQLYCVASRTLPGVVAKDDLEAWIRERSDPPAGQTRENAVLDALGTVIKAVQDNLWKAEHRRLRTTRPRFVASVGSHPAFYRILTSLGFQRDALGDGEEAWKMPNTSVGTPTRRKLLRAWVELSAWMSEYIRRHDRTLGTKNRFPSPVKMINVREEYQTAIGAHPDQLPRGGLDNLLVTVDNQNFYTLGLTPQTYTPELLAFCYFAQCRCDPSRTIEYFTAFFNIVEAMQLTAPEDLQAIVVEERARFRFTLSDIQSAARVLGFGIHEALGIEYDSDVDEEFIENAWRDCIKRAWRDPVRSDELQKAANDALRVLAESQGSRTLHKLWSSSSSTLMTPDKAFAALDVPSDVDESMLMMVFAMRLQDSPYQQERYKEALSVIAEFRESERLKKFCVTGEDPGEGFADVSAELPRGLNQLGNTCYLNSILQYFYTIKDLRDTVTKLNAPESKSLEDVKISEADLKKYRVGGRLVTQKEVLRSRKFVNQLANLFFNLEYAEQAAVTPTLELAKLALVTSRDEEEDDADRGGTDSSNDTDATLVDDDPQPRLIASENQTTSPVLSPGSILGKRQRELMKEASAMDVDIQVAESSSASPSRQEKASPMAIASPTPRRPEQVASGVPEGLNDSVIDLSDSPPPLETPDPRPPLPPRKSTVDSSGMMFGKQHDVAECLDNCMFQIETALLDFEGGNEAQPSEKTSIVKRLFYGRIRQRLSPFETDLKHGSIHEKEDLFSHLPVNVTEDGVDIYDGLSQYFDDVVEFQNSKARMEVSLVELPPLMQVQLQRVQFNRETQQPYKSQAYIKFGETLHMDRFLDNANPTKKATSKRLQRELRSCRERIRDLLSGNAMPYAQALKNTSKYLDQLEGLQVEKQLIATIAEESEFVTSSILQLQQQAEALKKELEDLWSAESEATYELTSVFIHRGSSPTFGHYFFYSRNLPDYPDAWFKYNDSQVTAVSKDEVLADTTGSTANPYLLVFARKGSQVVETVKRFDPNLLEQAGAMEV